MPKGTQPRLVPHRFVTLGAMSAEGVRVRSWCRTCDTVLEVSPTEMMVTRGADFSLIGHREPCRCVGCDGTVFFLANGHGRFEPLT